MVDIKTTSIPAKPRSKNYPAGAVITRTTGSVAVNGGGGGGASVDIVKATDTKSFTDSNVLSSLRTLLEIRSRIIAESDTATELTDDNALSSKRTLKEIDAAIEAVLKKIEELYISKKNDDTASGVITFLRGIIANALSLFKKGASFGNFTPGISGAIIDENGEIEAKSLVLRSFLSVPELRYNRAIVFKGKQIISPGGGCVVKQFITVDENTWLVLPVLEEGEALSFKVDDILLAYWHDKDSQSGAFKGFREMKFRVTALSGEEGFIIVPKPGSGSIPAASMTLAHTGNFTDTERQTYIMIDSTLGNNSLTFFDDANTWDVEPAQEKSWIGKKKNRIVAGIDCSKYSAVFQNIIMSGKIFQVDDITGESIRVPIEKGEYVSEQRYAYYDRVSYNRAMWLCVNENGTTSEPSDSNQDWLKQAYAVDSSSYWLTANATQVVIRPNSVVPIWTIVNCKKQTGAGSVENCNSFYLAYRRVDADGTKVTASANPTSSTVVAPSKTTTALSVRAYAVKSDAEAWNNNYVDEIAFGIVKDGSDGKDGKDGKIYEYIYKRTETETSPATPDEQYLASGWTDDPVGVDSSYAYEWVSQRIKDGETWSGFSAPSLWARYSKDGEDGKPGEGAVVRWLTASATQVIIKPNSVVPIFITVRCKQQIGTNPVENCNSLYVVYRRVDANGTNILVNSALGTHVVAPSKTTTALSVRAYENKTDAEAWNNNYVDEIAFGIVKDGRDGIDGVDGKEHEFIYKRTSTGIKPTTPDEQYLASGWTDDPVGVDSSYAYEWVSQRIKDNGIWGNFSVPSLWARYSKDGTDGKPGTDATSYWLTSNGSNFTYSSGGVFSPGNITVYCKKKTGASDAMTCSDFFIRVKKYRNGAISDHDYSSSKRSNVVITPSSYDSSYIVRAYQNLNDNNSWTDNFVAESIIGVVKDGQGGGSSTPGPPGADGQPGTDATSYWLTSTSTTVVFRSTGSIVPIFITVRCKKQTGAGPVENCNSFYLAYRRVDKDGTKVTVGSAQSSSTLMTVTASTTSLGARAYAVKSDAEAWNTNYVDEVNIGIIKDGTNGANGAMPRVCGRYSSGVPYVWDDNYRDIVFHSFGGVNYIFQVKVYGSSVSTSPVSVDGDDNWEPANRFSFVATDTLLADGANIADFMYKNGVMRSQAEVNGIPNLMLNGNTGEVDIRIGTFRGKVNTPFTLLGDSDAQNVSGMTNTFLLKDNLNIATSCKYMCTNGATIVLPTDIKYNGANVTILDFTYPPYNSDIAYTTVLVEGGDTFGNTLHTESQDQSQWFESDLINIRGGIKEFIAVPAYSTSGTFTKVKWFLKK